MSPEREVPAQSLTGEVSGEVSGVGARTMPFSPPPMPPPDPRGRDSKQRGESANGGAQ